ncbi:MAG: hypothetical protein EBV06_13085 [Planctomycetia bacterium]|nr:hypothetical protein [Planctomycetia bacterium]
MRRGIIAVALSLGVGVGLGLLPAAEDAVSSSIQVISKVGPEGTGNAEAAAAWKTLAKSGPEALVPILRALKTDAPLAANWLRPAFEAIAERVLTAKKLPQSDLVEFLEDTKNDPSARRLAYETLLKSDPTIADKYMPRMLKDPSPELRRDAVGVVLEHGDKLAKTGEKDAAKLAYEKALGGACDPDQVDAIATALKKFGVNVDVQKHFGIVTRWHLATPFDHTNRKGWDEAYPPEKGVDLKATYKGKDGADVKWEATSTSDAHGVVDINKIIKQYKGAICYAYATVESEKDQDVEFRAGCICGLKIFVNGKLLFAREEYHHGSKIDQYIVKGKLKAGTNEILLKVCQNEQTEAWAQKWTFQLRLSDAVGAAVPFTQKEAK